MQTPANRCSLVAMVCPLAAMLLLATSAATAAPARAPDVSFRHELDHAIDRGLAWLLANQNSNGWWSVPDNPAVTALALAAFLGEPSGKYRTNQPAELKQGFAYVLASAQPDGSIQRGKLANYNTALCMMALGLSGDPVYNDTLRRARAFVIGLQRDDGAPGKLDGRFDGGIGYGDSRPVADLVNTLTALEGLRATEYVVWKANAAKNRNDREGTTNAVPDLNWEAAIRFIENCQNLPKYNTQAWVSTSPRDLGGFVYAPADSKAGGETNADSGRVALRSYGSISYAGLLSYIYADVKGDDPRVVAVLDWLRANYTLDENPGMGEQGFYYYLHLMVKGLNAAGVDTIQLQDGRKVNWRQEVALRLLDLQQRDGSWVNRNNRWWEKDPSLVTAYAVLALEIIYRRI